MTRTIAGKRMTETNYNRTFARELKRHLGPAYPIPSEDWTTARYWFSIGKPPVEAAAELAEGRKQAMAAASRFHCRAWRDRYVNGIADDSRDGGEIIISPPVPEAVAVTIRAAFESGGKSGTVFHWAPEGYARIAENATDVRPEVYCWQSA